MDPLEPFLMMGSNTQEHFLMFQINSVRSFMESNFYMLPNESKDLNSDKGNVIYQTKEQID